MIGLKENKLKGLNFSFPKIKEWNSELNKKFWSNSVYMSFEENFVIAMEGILFPS